MILEFLKRTSVLIADGSGWLNEISPHVVQTYLSYAPAPPILRRIRMVAKPAGEKSAQGKPFHERSTPGYVLITVITGVLVSIIGWFLPTKNSPKEPQSTSVSSPPGGQTSTSDRSTKPTGGAPPNKGGRTDSFTRSSTDTSTAPLSGPIQAPPLPERKIGFFAYTMPDGDLVKVVCTGFPAEADRAMQLYLRDNLQAEWRFDGNVSRVLKLQGDVHTNVALPDKCSNYSGVEISVTYFFMDQTGKPIDGTPPKSVIGAGCYNRPGDAEKNATQEAISKVAQVIRTNRPE
jgi:hypothetical protein